jgi:hypothetical protein
VINDFPEVIFRNPINFHCGGFINQVKQGWKRIAQTDTSTASMAMAEYSFQFCIQLILIIKIRIPPVNRMPDGRFQTALPNLSCAHFLFIN